MKHITRTLLALMLCCALAFGVAACAPQQAPAAATPAPTPAAPVETASPEPVEVIPPIEDGPEDFDEATINVLNGMHAAYDSSMRALMRFEEGMRYFDRTDPVFFWEVLYYMCANYGELHPLCEKTDTQYILPASALREFADACFFGMDDELPELPAQEFDIVYDEETQTYHIGLSDAGDTYAQPISYATNAAGNIEATVGWMDYSDEGAGPIATFVFELVPNENAGDGEPVFQYSVLSVREAGAAQAEGLGDMTVIDLPPPT